MRDPRLLAALYLSLFVSLGEAEESWHEVRSGELTLVTNAGGERAEGLLAELLAFRRVLSRALPAATFDATPTQVYAFRDFASLYPFLPHADERGAWASGFFRRGPVKNVIAIDASSSAASSRALYHEYVHLVSSRPGRPLPFWFEEGLSELYATVRIEGGRAEIGRPDARHLDRLARGDLLPLEILLEADREDPVGSEPLFYAQSWLLVHYYLVGGRDGGPEALAEYLAALGRGAGAVAALPKRPELESYRKRPSFETMRVELGALSRDNDFPGAVRLSRAEVQHRWAELFLFTGRQREARVCLDEALRLAPSLRPLQETLGLAALEQGHLDAARGHFEAAIELGGATPTGLALYARALLHDYSGPFVQSIPEPVAREAEAALRASLRLEPSQSETARLLAFVYLVRSKRLGEAEALVRGALLLEPGDPSLRYLEGQLLARRGEYDRARDVLGAVIRDAAEPALRDAARVFLERMGAVERAPQD